MMLQVKNFSKLILCALLLLVAGCKDKNEPAPTPTVTPGTAENPNWVITVENDLTSSMTMVVKVTIGDEDGTLAAFIGEDCCGLATLVDGLYILYISAPESGSAITLKFYSPAQKHIYTANESLVFQADINLGTVADPYTPTWTVTQ